MQVPHELYKLMGCIIKKTAKFRLFSKNSIDNKPLCKLSFLKRLFVVHGVVNSHPVTNNWVRVDKPMYSQRPVLILTTKPL